MSKLNNIFILRKDLLIINIGLIRIIQLIIFGLVIEIGIIVITNACI